MDLRATIVNVLTISLGLSTADNLRKLVTLLTIGAEEGVAPGLQPAGQAPWIAC